MRPEDAARLQREADIARAVRGPDYSQLEISIRKAKAAAARNAGLQAEINASWLRAGAREIAKLREEALQELWRKSYAQVRVQSYQQR